MRKKTCFELPPESVIFGRSREMLRLQQDLKRASAAYLPILLKGERGVGKNLLSRYIHSHLSANGDAYFRYSCPVMSSAAIDSLLLTIAGGHRSGAGDRCEGTSEMVSTVFLDEVGELVPELQGRLLHGLAEIEEFSQNNRLRIICSTTEDLRQAVRMGKFRKELFYRFAVVIFEVPPLRCRLDDLSLIATYLRDSYGRNFGITAQPFPTNLMKRMHDYHWPGNIRELKTFVRCNAVLARQSSPGHA